MAGADPDHRCAPGLRQRVAHLVAGAEADQREKLETAARRTRRQTGLGTAFGLLAAVTLDGVPENLALGVSLIGSEDGSVGGSLALLVAIFGSNLPESLVGAVAMRQGRNTAAR